MLESLERHYGPLKNSRHIWTGCAPERFIPGEKEDLILGSGRLWDRAKNMEALSAAARSTPWPIYVAGQDLAPDGKRTWLEDVQMLGRLSSKMMARWLSHASIYAHPARYEPFGISVLEAALSKCALVLGDIQSLREVWDEAAHFVPPDDTRALAAVMNMLIGDPQRRNEWASRAATRARDLTARAMADAYLDVYRSMITESDASPKQ
jgi:glycosyltransferase involved in cell wall biosynthesis